MDKKTRSTYMLPPRDPSQITRYKQTKSKGMEKIFHANGKEKKAGVAVLISDKTDFKTNPIIRDKEGHYKMIKGTIQQEDKTILNIYTPNIGAPKCVKQILMDVKGEMNRNTARVGDINAPLISMGISSRYKINRKNNSFKQHTRSNGLN